MQLLSALYYLQLFCLWFSLTAGVILWHLSVFSSIRLRCATMRLCLCAPASSRTWPCCSLWCWWPAAPSGSTSPTPPPALSTSWPYWQSAANHRGHLRPCLMLPGRIASKRRRWWRRRDGRHSLLSLQLHLHTR